MKYALIGNPNSGKTTLFNQLTGSNQHVGNFPGVTVETKEGPLKTDKNVLVVDLPGIYSLSPYSEEEIVTRNYLLYQDIDLIINIVDATNIERNLYLTLQLMELGKPVVIALNMMDEIRANGDYIDVEGISAALQIPIVPVAAAKNQGIRLLTEVAAKTAAEEERRPHDMCRGEIHKAIHSIAHLIEDKAKKAKIPIRFAAIKVMEEDELVLEKLALSEREQHIIQEIIEETEKRLHTDKDAAIADMRYGVIEEICAGNVRHGHMSVEQQRSERIDRLLTHRIFAIPIFLAVMALIFWLTFGPLGSALGYVFTLAIDGLIGLICQGLEAWGVSYWLYSLIVDGALAGVGSVLSFLPVIVLLFFFLSIVEDSGYMARVAFVMDRLLRKIGLSGRSFIPMLIGFGCSVPAILSTRTLSSRRDRIMTIALVPFMSCSAKLPIYGLFTSYFFPDHAALVMICLYVLGMVVAVLYGLLLKHTVFKGESAPFIMELPAYRLPSAKSIGLNVWDKAQGFIKKAFSIIFIASLVIWFLRSFDWRFQWAAESSQSLLAAFGALIAPIFQPLGFGSWQAATALLTGLSAKEAVVSTLAVLVDANGLGTLFTPLSAFSFLVFTLLYMPCFASLAVIQKELHSKKKAALLMLCQTGIAWLVACIVYQIGRIFIA